MNTLQCQSIALMIWTLNIQVVDIAIALPKFDALTQLAWTIPGFPDRIIATKTTIGYFTNFIWGDYFYAVIKTSSGNITFLVDLDEDCFLAYHQNVKLQIRYDRLQRYLPQAGGYHSISVIRDIQTDRTDLARWRRSTSSVKLKQCRQLIEKATKSH